MYLFATSKGQRCTGDGFRSIGSGAWTKFWPRTVYDRKPAEVHVLRNGEKMGGKRV